MYTRKLDVEDLQSTRGDFDGPAAYARTKRAEVVLTEMLAERLAGTGVVVHAMHPGWADTPGVQSSLPRFHALTRPLLRTPAQGADTIVWLGAAAAPAQSSGGFWHDRRERPTHRVPWTRESPADRDALWAACEQLSGLDAHQGVT
jgi:NAD(P)-dependent dehydrogenase (short-subunit alcohol dehydrogenase family)